jgi:hypothetical protein
MRRFAEASGDSKTGLKLMISGPIFIEKLVGVGWRMMVLGSRLGTLVGTLEPMPMCVLQAHVVARAGATSHRSKESKANHWDHDPLSRILSGTVTRASHDEPMQDGTSGRWGHAFSWRRSR